MSDEYWTKKIISAKTITKAILKESERTALEMDMPATAEIILEIANIMALCLLAEEIPTGLA